MSTTGLRRMRNKKAAEQRYLCFYCRFPMWSDRAEAFAGRHHITLGEAGRFRCTAEHLPALGDGGKTIAGNIVAACHFCNERRHRRAKRPSWTTCLARVRRRIAAKSWHPPTLHRLQRSIASPAN